MGRSVKRTPSQAFGIIVPRSKRMNDSSYSNTSYESKAFMAIIFPSDIYSSSALDCQNETISNMPNV